ncbi:uncharacterized protein PADG_02004 [Paracoccidioides brasiliensis Pb18]|uniref:BTB domain-containing protein n=1 Tax=Paracoccidioides brasiliensis (strain Pb18) TaxID=502780 RepID=C1G4Y8_PARBD|nr:uncharacterized protein PADG_02004 [Paracoccidioides brasiliensis Pb18]EEH45854.2 hypothetical protein PADG_02004 [Paracoccidioides brasiliensis Pb18]
MDPMPFTPLSPYETKIIWVSVGPVGKQRTFGAHLGILSQSPSLIRKICPATTAKGRSLSLDDINPVVFELALRFLYAGNYQVCSYSSTILPTPEDSALCSDVGLDFEIHSLVYCFAREYAIDRLAALAIGYIKNMTQVPYWKILDVAKKVYPKLHDDDGNDMYRAKFMHETRRAMKNNFNLVRETWLLDVFKNEHGNLTVDLFTTLTEPLIMEERKSLALEDQQSFEDTSEQHQVDEPLSPSQTNYEKGETMHWNGDGGDHEFANHIPEPPAAPKDEGPPLSPPQQAISNPNPGFHEVVYRGYSEQPELKLADEESDWR